MNTQNRIVIAGACALVAVAVAAYVVGRNAGRQSDISKTATVEQTAGKRVLYWRDPMVPDKRFDKPGKSPFMDMQLVPVYEGDSTAADGSVAIDPRVQQKLGLRLALVERKSIAADFSVPASIEYDDRNVAVVQARANGFVERVYARTPFQLMQAGEALADVYMPEWVAAQEELLSVLRMQSDMRETLAAAAEQRMRLVGMTDEQIAGVKLAKSVQPRMTLRAPIAGVITELLAREGMTISNGAPLFRLNGLNTVWAYAEIPESQLSQVHVGQDVTLSAAAFPGESLTGKVLAVLPELSATTRTARARIELPNRKRLLAPGMFATVHFEPSKMAAVLSVPSEAIITTGQRSVVILAEEGDRFKPVEVMTGMESHGITEITHGLEDGQRVVVSGQFLIDSEANLKATANRMSEQPQAPVESGDHK